MTQGPPPQDNRKPTDVKSTAGGDKLSPEEQKAADELKAKSSK